VQLVDYRWNRFYSSLLLMHEKLVKLGVAVRSGEIVIEASGTGQGTVQ
jgi:hypothetical protein